MSSSRVVRGTKGRIIFCVCAIFIIVAIVACYNNTLSQLDEVRKGSEQCHQQQENLSTQLQVIFDYKQRLEKSLKTEKAEHQQTKKIFEAKLEEEHSKNEKAVIEANLKFSSLQQHFNLLKTQHDDFKEECSKMQQQQLDEINILQAKLKEVQGQMKHSMTDKDNAFEQLKNKYMQLEVDKENLEQHLQNGQNKDDQTESAINHLKKVNHQLKRELDDVKEKCSTSTKSNQLPLKSQKLSSPANESNVEINSVPQAVDNKEHVADLPSNVDDLQVANVLAAPKTEKPVVNNDVNNVIPIPNLVKELLPNQKTSTTAKSNLVAVSPKHSPIVNNKMSAEEAPKIPEGVAPAPAIEKAIPNRYRTNIIAKEDEANVKKPDDNVGGEEMDSLGNNIGRLDPFANEENHGQIPKHHLDGADYDDKDAPNGAHENDETEDDDPDYPDPLARQKDIAIRN